jgi:hypothetical protein
VQTTAANQPRLILSDTNFNNNPSIEFISGSAARSLASVPSRFYGLGEVTIAIVYKIDATSTNGNRILSDATSGNNAVGLASNGANAGMNGLGLYNVMSTSAISGTTENFSPHIGVLSRQFVYVDGVLEASGSNSYTGSFSQIGSMGGSGNTGAQCRIAELLIYNSLFSQASMLELSNALNRKYLRY